MLQGLCLDLVKIHCEAAANKTLHLTAAAFWFLRDQLLTGDRRG